MKITIDGPAGSGKSTVAGKIAKRLGFIHLNSGALYRVIGLKAEAAQIALDDQEAICAFAEATSFEFELVAGSNCTVMSVDGMSVDGMSVDGQDLAQQVLSAHAGELASKVAVLPRLRQVLTNIQRQAAERHSLVLEGRDAGTVVFPEAEFKFYLEASAEVRAKRRYEQLVGEQLVGEQLVGVGSASEIASNVSLAEIKQSIIERDNRDRNREIAPDIAADDAQVIDTTQLSIAEVVELICAVVAKSKISS